MANKLPAIAPQPSSTGWHWFLPDENCATPTGLLRIDTPVIVLVGVDKVTRDMPPARLVVRFPTGPMFVEQMTGDWQKIECPKELTEKARSRW